MSAYLFIVAHQNTQQVNKKKTKSGSSKSSKNSRTDDLRSISTKSTKSSNSTNSSYIPKKKFDATVSNYVPVSDYEQVIARYERKFNKLISECKFHDTNEKLNRYHCSNGDLLINEKNLNILRYSFFKNITANYDDILKDMKKKKSDGKTPKLRYLRKLKEAKTRQKSDSVNGLPNLSTDNLTIMDTYTMDNQDFHDLSESSSDDDEADEDKVTRDGNEGRSQPKNSYDNKTNNNFNKYFDDEDEDEDDEINNLYNQYSKMNKHVSIRDLIKSNQFWNNVYQDLKYNLMEISTTINYFELLPNITQLITFYKEVIEYFLINLQDLRCNTSKAKDLTDAEMENLKHYRFYHLKDFNYEWFKIMSNLHYKFFNNQSILNNSLSILQDQDLQIHKKLISRIILTIIENFKISLGYQLQSLNHVFKIWEDFLFFLMNELIFKFYGDYDDLNIMNNISLPEPNLHDMNSQASSSNLTSNLERSKSMSMESIYSSNSLNNSNQSSFETANITSPEIDQSSIMSDNELNLNIQKITKNTKNLQINTFNSSLMMSSPISRIDEEDDFNLSINSNYTTTPSGNYNYKRGGFVIEPPTPRYGESDIPTPLSGTFSINSTDTNKSYTSRKSIFSKLRRSRK